MRIRYYLILAVLLLVFFFCACAPPVSPETTAQGIPGSVGSLAVAWSVAVAG